MRRLIFLIIVIISLIGCNSITSVIEKDDILNFTIEEIIEENVTYIKISGLIGWSAFFYDKIKTDEKNNEMYILLYGTIIKKHTNSSGTFSIEIPINENIDIIYFGKNNNIILERN